ncbi:hypothetical protein PSQ19_16070 [Devosia algicola]|uniref:DUF2892 domain-containing protein n=1 Tax=Devosia algicola TaxID=3026418 RepID=A0ABY7YM46_9HYPH|nr:hypothetical protein [Devosia algicola]WDR02155.1 hypothetical protein PSQ19_16070 [Devosia algicola]
MPVRIGFVAALFGLIALVLTSSILQSPGLFPLVVMLLALPAAVRLASVCTYRTPVLAPITHRPDNEEPASLFSVDSLA